MKPPTPITTPTATTAWQGLPVIPPIAAMSMFASTAAILAITMAPTVGATPASTSARAARAALAAPRPSLYLPVNLARSAVAPTPEPMRWPAYEPAAALAVRDVRVLSDPNEVRDIAIDPRTGDVWAATGGGVVRWAPDALTPTVKTAVDDLWLAADDVAVGRDGVVWAVTDRGAARRSADGAWTAVQPPPLPTPPALPSTPAVMGAARAAAAAQAEPVSPVVPRSVAIDRDGTVFIGLDGGVARRTADGRWSHEVFETADAVDRIVAADNGDLWLSRPSNRRSPLSVEHPGGTGRAFEPGLAGLRVKAAADVALAPDGSAWALSALGPPVVADVFEPAAGDPATDGGRWRPAPLGDVDDALRGVARAGLLRRIAFDARGRAYVLAEGVLLAPAVEAEPLTAGAPAADSAPSTWSVTAVDDGPLAPLDALRALAVRADGEAWIGGERGMAVRGASGGVTLRRAPGLSANRVTAVAVAGGDVWFGTMSGADRLAPDGRLTHVDVPGGDGADIGSADHRVNDIVVSPDGAVWFATPTGVARRAPDGAWTTFGAADGLREPWVHALALGDDGSLWCAWGRAGQRSDGRGTDGVSRRGPDGAWTHFGFDAGLPALVPTSVLVRRDGSVWAGFDTALAWHDQPFGDRNLAYYRPETGWIRVSPPAPVGRDAVYALAETPDGALWVLSARGVSRLTADGVWTTFADGTAGRFGATRESAALAVGADGSVWVGSRWAPLHLRRPDGTWRVAAPALASEAATDIAVDADGRVWVGTVERGARGFDPGR